MNLSRFCVTAAAIVLAGCTNGAATERYYLGSGGAVQEQPVAEVSQIDAAMAQFLSQEGDALILLPNRLEKSKLDYSLDSLAEIDRWLADVHTVNRLQSDVGRAGEALVLDGRGENSVTFAGLYLGQIIRANSEQTWFWERFDTFLAANPAFAEHYGRDAELDTFVLIGPQGVATPINTALKRVVHGKEESLAFIANLLIKDIDLDEALSSQDLLGMDRADWAG
ncbi:MAG: hypothetical protein AAFV37_01950 [Pseudomonadota bacterium]